VRAVVTTGFETMKLTDRAAPGDPAAGEVLLRTEAVGICGSDVHYYKGDIGFDPATLYPRIQGHEISARVDAVGAGASVEPGQRVAVFPVASCGACYPCSVARPNACSNISIIGIHRDGALQDTFLVPAEHAFAADDLTAETAAFIEPTSIGVRTVNRAGIAGPVDVVVLGAGPIGLTVALAAGDRGARVLVVDLLEERLAHARSVGAETVRVGGLEDIQDAARAWSGGEGPPIVVEATGVPEAVQASIDAVAPTGKVVVVGLSGRPAPVVVGKLPFQELDVVGVSTCQLAEFGEAVALVGRHRDTVARLITHRFAAAEANAAMRFVIENPAEVLKAVIEF
jgi:threonine dehydrogenase-like Zn-dependent dehydrogenase